MRILIATDGSPHAEKALHVAAGIVDPAEELPTVLTVIGQREDASTRIERIQVRVSEILGDPAARIRVRVGHPGENIVNEATTGDYDLVIVGRQPQRSLWKHLFQSSTTMHVVEKSPCPVIVAQGKISPIRRILLCDSGTGNTPDGPGTRPGNQFPDQDERTWVSPSRLGRFTAQLAAQIKGKEEVTVLHVMSQISAGPGVRGTQLRAGADELIEERSPEGDLLVRDVQTLEQPGIHPNAKVRHGLVVDEILSEARSGDYDLVVIGAHRNRGWQRVLLDDLARRILARLDRPVLVVK